jgi:hypothetical protein
LKELLSTKSFSVPAVVTVNDVPFQINALVDCGANVSILIHTDVVLKLIPLGLKTRRLKSPVTLSTSDNRPSEAVTYAVRIPLIVAGKKQKRVTALITNIGRHDMILGRLWCAERDALIDCKRLRLVWPEPKTEKEEVEIMKEEVACAVCCDMRLVQIRNQPEPSELIPKYVYEESS